MNASNAFSFHKVHHVSTLMMKHLEYQNNGKNSNQKEDN